MPHVAIIYLNNDLQIRCYSISIHWYLFKQKKTKKTGKTGKIQQNHKCIFKQTCTCFYSIHEFYVQPNHSFVKKAMGCIVFTTQQTRTRYPLHKILSISHEKYYKMHVIESMTSKKKKLYGAETEWSIHVVSDKLDWRSELGTTDKNWYTFTHNLPNRSGAWKQLGTVTTDCSPMAPSTGAPRAKNPLHCRASKLNTSPWLRRHLSLCGCACSSTTYTAPKS